jgi:hypothetical protein
MLIKDMLAFSAFRLLMVLLYGFLLCLYGYRQVKTWIKKRILLT